MKCGLRTDYCRDWGLEKLLGWACQAGFDGIQLCTAAAAPGEIAAAIREGCSRAQQHGLRVASVSPSCLCSAGSPVAAEPEKREEAFRAFQEIAQACGESGIEVVLLPFFGRYIIEREEPVALLVSEIGRYGEVCAQCGVQAALESSLDADQLWRVMDAGGEHVGVYLDPANVQRFCGALIEQIERAKGRVMEMHAKDQTYGEKAINMPLLGRGQTNLSAAYKIMKAAGYDRWIVLETAAGEHPEANAAANLRYVKSLWENL